MAFGPNISAVERRSMSTAFVVEEKATSRTNSGTRRAAVFHGADDIRIEEVSRPHAGRGEAVALRVLRRGGTLSSLAVYSGKLQFPYDAFAAGLGDHRIVTTLCPGGKQRMRRLIEMVCREKLDLRPLPTHRPKLADINAAYPLFGSRAGGVMKVAVTP
jgi:alcohol dehydrogenase